MSIPFLKMHGLGNDFVVIDDLGKPEGLCHRIDARLARELCDRRFGVGADQIVWLKAPRDASLDARVEFVNADGSQAEMCGNGMRAAALYLFRHGPKRKPAYSIESLSGTQLAEVTDPQVSVNMGQPRLGGGFDSPQGETLRIDVATELGFHEVSMGNPHAVVFVADAQAAPVETLGPRMETHPRFPNRTNVEFVEVTGSSSIRVRVWERGAGVTLACGSGACASAVAAIALERVKSPVDVELPGGRLRIRWAKGEPVVMEGPAEEVFRGEYFQPEPAGS